MTAKPPIRDLERDLKREPGNLALRLKLAAAYREAGRAGDAVELYRSVARAYAQQGRNGQAAAVCRSALEIVPTDSELFGMLQHLDRSQANTIAPPMGQPVGSPPAMPAPLEPPPSARVLPNEVAMREVGSVAPTVHKPATVKHVPPPPPRTLTPPPGRASSHGGTLDTDTPLPDPLPLHESTGRDSLVEMVEILTGPSRSTPSSPSLPAPPLPAPPAPLPPLAVGSLGSGVRPPPRGVDDDSETIVPLTNIRSPGTIPPSPGPRTTAPMPAVRPPAPPTRPPAPRPLAPTPAPAPSALPRLSSRTAPPPMTVKAPPPAPIDDPPTERGGLPSAADFAAEMITRKRPKLSARDLSLLDLDPLSAGDGGDTGIDEALTNPGRGPSPPAARRPNTDARPTAPQPAMIVDDEDGITGDSADTGDTGQSAAVFDDEPTHPPPAGSLADGTMRGDSEDGGTATDQLAPRPFEQPFDATLSSLGPDGSVLEGPLGVFSMLPPEAAHELNRRAVVKQFDPGEVIIREGDPGDACYVIARGVVVVQKRTDEDSPAGAGVVELARLTDGSMFGEFALLADRRRHATVMALTDVEVYEIPRLLLRELAAVFPEVGPALERFYRERLLANLLRTTPLFNMVPEDQRPALLARFHPLHAESGQAIVRQGERAGGLYLIVLGAVEVVRRVGERRAVVLATLGEGAYFGEMSLLSGEMASASVVAAGPCELAVLPPRNFYDLVSHNPELWTTMRSIAEARRLANAQILAGHTGIV